MNPNRYRKINSDDAGTDVIVSGVHNAILFKIHILTTSAFALGIYDSNITSPAAADKIGELKLSVAEGSYGSDKGMAMNKGIVIKVPASYVGFALVEYN